MCDLCDAVNWEPTPEAIAAMENVFEKLSADVGPTNGPMVAILLGQVRGLIQRNPGLMRHTLMKLLRAIEDHADVLGLPVWCAECAKGTGGVEP